MESFIKADIFFFISSISVIIFTVFFIIIGFHLAKVMKNFSHISEKLKNAVDDADSELREMSEHVRESAIFNFIFGKKKVKKRTTK